MKTSLTVEHRGGQSRSKLEYLTAQGGPNDPLVIVVPGLLSETRGVSGLATPAGAESGGEVWYQAAREAFVGTRCRVALFSWKAGSSRSLASELAVGMGLVSPATLIGGAVAGVILADAIWNLVQFQCWLAARELTAEIDKEPQDVAMIGHSLGARVVFRTLASTRRSVRCATVFGAAVGSREFGRRIPIPKPCVEPIEVVYSRGDDVLKRAFRVGFPTRGAALGFTGLPAERPGFRSFDAECLLDPPVGHFTYADRLSDLLQALPAWRSLQRDFPA